MKIVIAVHHFPPHYKAGAELRAYDEAVWFQRQGHGVNVVCVEHIDRGPTDGLLWEDTEYEGIPVQRLSFDLAKAPDQFRWEYDNPWVEKHLRDYLAQIRPDVFHLISGYLLGAGALRAARALDIPFVITLTDFWFLCPRINLLRSNGKLSDPEKFDAAACARCKFEEQRRFRIPAQVAPGAVNWFWTYIFESGWGKLFDCEKMADQFRQRNHILMEMLSAAQALICPSRFVVETFRARGVDPDNLIFNAHGLDCSSWLPSLERDKSDRIFRIGYLGQIDSHKGVHLLVKAFTQLRSDCALELVIYGNETAFPRYTQSLRQLAQGDERVKILGRYNPEQVAQVLAPIDVLVIPSIWNEIGPLVMYESLQTKTPVVASNIPNMSDVIRHERNGLLFACGDSTDLTHQLQRLVDEPALVSQLRANIQPVKSIAEEMNTLQDIYHSLVANHLEEVISDQRVQQGLILMQTPRVAIIILNWNGRDDTLACLASLSQLDYSAYQVILVDNDSSDDSVAAIRAAHPQVTLIETDHNLGYVGGNNLGLEDAKKLGADHALLLNNDTEVAPDFLKLLVETAEADPCVGIVGPMIYYYDRPDVIWSAGGEIDWKRGTTQMIGLNEVDQGQFGNVPRPVDFVTGCALLIKMSLVAQIGLLDARFFAYFEETEWCVRAQRAGFKILHVPQAKVWHKISPVAREASPQVHYYMTRNRLLFLRLSRAGTASWLNTLLLDYGRTLLSWTLKSKWRHKAPQRQAMLRAIRDYGLGHFGKVDIAKNRYYSRHEHSAH